MNKRNLTPVNSALTVMSIVAFMVFLFQCTVVGLVIWAACHFITKYW